MATGDSAWGQKCERDVPRPHPSRARHHKTWRETERDGEGERQTEIAPNGGEIDGGRMEGGAGVCLGLLHHLGLPLGGGGLSFFTWIFRIP